MTLSTPIAGSLTLWDLVIIAVTIAAAFIIARLVSLYLKRAFSGKVRGKDLDLLLKIVSWAIIIITVLLIFSQLNIDLSGLLIAGGIIGIVIGIASQSVVGNLISGIFLIIERPISIGDEVRIGDVEGYIQDIHILSTVMRTHQGTYLRMPNQQVFTSNIMNFVAHPARRVEYSLGMHFAEDTGRVREVILGVLAASPYALVRPEPEVNVAALADDRVLLSVYFWTPSRAFTDAKSVVLEDIRRELAGRGIAVPPPARLVSRPRSDAREGGS